MNSEQYHLMRSVEDRHWWYVGTRAIAHDLLATLPIPKMVLDAGCGTGGNHAMLRRHGKVVAIDLSELALELTATRGGVPLARASVTQLPFSGATFDLVTSFEVLYHRGVGDDVDAMRELCRVLRPGGHLLLRVPALEWLRGAHDEAVHGARRYTRHQLESKLRSAGLTPMRVTYLNTLLLPLAAAKRLLERLTGATGDDLGPTPRPLAALFRAALTAERHILRRRDLPAGVSIMALARRPDMARQANSYQG